MRRILYLGLMAGLLLVLLAGCGRQTGTDPGLESQSDPNLSASPSHGAQEQTPSEPGSQDQRIPSSSPSGETEPGETSREEALAIALNNAGVPEADAYNIKNERGGDNGIPIYDIEFETNYGDYDFQVAIADGRIVGADYEVDEEWLDTLGGDPVSLEEAAAIVAGKVSGSSSADVDIWEESGDGRGRYEGELFFDGMKYEFEIDPQTGIIFDWNADLRN